MKRNEKERKEIKPEIAKPFYNFIVIKNIIRHVQCSAVKLTTETQP